MRLFNSEKRRIFVYGDSFAANYGSLMTWPKLVREKINIPMTIRAVQGSSTEYAMLNFYKDMPKIGVDDIVIFSMSNVGRLHFKDHLTFPSSSVTDVYLNKINQEYIEHLNWYLSNVDDNLTQINHASYVNTIKEYARSELNRTILLFLNPTVTVEFPSGNMPTNLLVPKITPTEISQDEFVTRQHWPFILNSSHIDVRINHLSQPNLNILSNAVVESINSRSTIAIDQAPYIKGIFERFDSISDYKKYETAGYIVPYSYWQTAIKLK